MTNTGEIPKLSVMRIKVLLYRYRERGAGGPGAHPPNNFRPIKNWLEKVFCASPISNHWRCPPPLPQISKLLRGPWGKRCFDKFEAENDTPNCLWKGGNCNKMMHRTPDHVRRSKSHFCKWQRICQDMLTFSQTGVNHYEDSQDKTKGLSAKTNKHSTT